MAKPKRSSSLAEWIKRSRGKRTQRELATLAEVSHQAWSQLENDGVIPPERKLKKICEALGKSLSEVNDILIVEEVAESRKRNFDYAFRKLKSDLIERAKKQGRRTHLQVFVLREDEEPVDPVSVDQH